MSKVTKLQQRIEEIQSEVNLLTSKKKAEGSNRAQNFCSRYDKLNTKLQTKL